MLYKLLKIDEASKNSALKFAIFNLLVTFLLSACLVIFVFILFCFYDEETAAHISRLIWVEIILNSLFYPLAIVLLLGVKRDNFKWINMWVKAKVVQASYIFLFNFVIQVYITASLDFGDGFIVLIYTLVLEVFYMETIIFMNNYHKNNVSEEKSELPGKEAEDKV